MTPLTIAVVAFFLALLLFGFAFWTPIYAIPLALLFIAGLGVAEMLRRRGSTSELREFRGQAQSGRPNFTDRDRETMYDHR